jgi:copper chaperone CopZ
VNCVGQNAALAPFGTDYHLKDWVEIMAEFTLLIDGMHCGSCIKRVSQALSTVEGAKVEEVRLGAARIRCDDCIEKPAPVDIALAALAQAGYTARLDQ